jgi:hypothetical protein
MMCRAKKHIISGQNIAWSGGKRRCRQCWADRVRYSRNARKLQEQAGFAEPIENLSLRELDQRLDQAKIMLETAQQVFHEAQKTMERQNRKQQRAKRALDRAQERFETAVALTEKLDQLRTEKANNERQF